VGQEDFLQKIEGRFLRAINGIHKTEIPSTASPNNDNNNNNLCIRQP
jgi:hypothetical protein